VQNTSLIATVPRIAAEQYTRETRVLIMRSPCAFELIRILMSWLPSTTVNPRCNGLQVRDIARQLA